jgi:VWFA-related protein
MPIRLAVFTALTALAVFTSPAAAQERPVFRSGTDLVRFDLRVVDASGNPIRDLSAGEIEIREGDERRPVLVFQHIEEPAGVYTDAAVRAVSAEVSSNEGAPRGHLYILVFDQHHIAPGNEQRARRAAQAFIERRVRPSDRVAVFGLPGPGPQLGFTADRGRATAELQRVRGGLERETSTPMGSMSVQEAHQIVQGNDRTLVDLTSRFAASRLGDVAGAGGSTSRTRPSMTGEDPAIFRRLIQENARTLVAQADAESRQFLQALADLIGQYRSIEGRKSVVLFSEGFHQQNVSRELESVAASAAQAYCVFYSFDLNGRFSNLQGALPSPDSGVEIQQRLEPLGSLAAETGGLLVNDANEQLEQALDRLASQSEGYYLVGFEPSAEALADRRAYRRITVNVTRPGARVSARTGYAVGPEPTPADRRRAIDAALGTPFVQQGLRVEYTTYVLRSDESGKPRVFLSLASELPVRQQATDRADVVFAVRDTRDGRVVASGTDTIALPASPEEGSPLGVGRYRVHFDAPPGSYMMRAIVREPGGLIGSADRRFEVRRVDGLDVAASDIVFGGFEGALPVHARAHKEDGMTALVEAYARTRSQVDGVMAVMDLLPPGSNMPVASIEGELNAPEPSGTGVKRRARFALPLAHVPPGAYVARVRVNADGQTAVVTREVRILPGSAAAAGLTSTLDPRDVLSGEVVSRFAERVKRHSSHPASPYALRGLQLFGEGRFAEAASALDQAFARDQTDAAAAFALGWAHEAAGARRDAISAWRAAAAIDPTLIPAHLALADAYLKIAQPALAAQALRAGLTALPDSVELRTRLEAIERRE